MVTFVDETTSGTRHEAWELAVAEERLALREVIRRRVFQEVAEHNAGQGTAAFAGLVRPEDPASRRVDAERQFEQAVRAFGRNGFLVLVGDRQMEELDEEIELALGTEVTFLKLVPLVGG